MAYSMWDEIMADRSYDDPAPSAPEPGLPWDDDPLFLRRPAGRAADALVKATAHEVLLQDIFGTDRALEMLALKPNATAMALSKRIDAISTATISNLLAKSERVAADAPLRKARIGEIVKGFRRSLIAKGYDADGYDLQPLQASCETLVAALIMAV